jgi:hypothetical protein
MTTIEIALRSYRHLLTKHHPKELKQSACVDTALVELTALTIERDELKTFLISLKNNIASGEWYNEELTISEAINRLLTP